MQSALQNFFYNLSTYWLTYVNIEEYVTPKKLWKFIVDLHDVSKHRSRLYHSIHKSIEEIDIPLDKNPKLPNSAQNQFQHNYPWTLKDHLIEFINFMDKSFDLLIKDLKIFIERN